MKKNFNRRLGRKVYEIFAGEYITTTSEDNAVLSTLLGSCVAVCLHDSVNLVSGMNHFMLPGKISKEDLLVSEDARYGMYSMEVLVNEMLKAGAKKERLKAKIFGGGKVLNSKTSLGNVSKSNVEFTKTFLDMENIPVITSDVGKNVGRKLFFYPETFTVYVKKISYGTTVEEAVRREKRFYENIKKDRKDEGEDVLLFDSE